MLDYLVVTHLHGDHMAGLPELGQLLRIGKILDRGWPDYQVPPLFTGKAAKRDRAALNHQIELHGATVARFKAGAADQIVLLRRPELFPAFEVRNLAVNAEVWTGEGTQTRSRIPAGESIDENARSAALRLRYGRFDYFNAGDLPGGAVERLVPGTESAPTQISARRPGATSNRPSRG